MGKGLIIPLRFATEWDSRRMDTLVHRLPHRDPDERGKSAPSPVNRAIVGIFGDSAACLVDAEPLRLRVASRIVVHSRNL